MPRRPSTEEWSALLAEFEQSGLQQKEFCAKHDLSIAAFQYWYLPEVQEALRIGSQDFRVLPAHRSRRLCRA